MASYKSNNFHTIYTKGCKSDSDQNLPFGRSAKIENSILHKIFSTDNLVDLNVVKIGEG